MDNATAAVALTKFPVRISPSKGSAGPHSLIHLISKVLGPTMTVKPVV